MKPSLAKVLTILTFVLALSGCGTGKGDTNSDASPAPSQSTSTSATATTEVKSSSNEKSLGKVEVVGEKTKIIDKFEITLDGGDVQQTLNQSDGKKQKPLNDEILVMKAKIKSIKNTDADTLNELHNFTIYNAGETQMGENYIGFDTGMTGQNLEGNLMMERYLQNEVHEGYIYLDVEKRDAYRIKYEDVSGESGYWDVKITN
ncbi:hypothetical protein B5M42_024985 [Paenibacillus athensensis]|uniref:DUF4352 domain-containing protein n=1 Tax=Paenibacillus athensensis TaxID=1967502 RepID=A0A4Y8PPA0_9BACL|nr:hypothetical protein [Paenibacillus athensensis]MCD1262040.1 hypothetical protein [Paenibacillus athensensis]